MQRNEITGDSAPSGADRDAAARPKMARDKPVRDESVRDKPDRDKPWIFRTYAGHSTAAAWLLALYIALADEENVPRATLQGTTQNDIIKEYLSRGTYVFPPAPSMRLTKDVILFTTKEMPKWNPINVCSYHLQEAGATPVQEVAFALATAIGVLDGVKASGQCAEEEFGDVVGRISFFVNAGLRFVTEICKMRAFTELWEEDTRTRYGVRDPKQRPFCYGVQVNSLGVTE